MTAPVSINIDRLSARIAELATIGAIAGGGNARIALTDADRDGRDRVVGWMRELGLDVSIDAIGNVFGVLKGRAPGPALMIGSHIDTVGTGGRYDGNLGVLAGLEIVARLKELGLANRRPLSIAFFTNEEGVRYAPDMMGSLVYAGGLPLQEALDAKGTDGTRLGDELQRIGYAGPVAPGANPPFAYLELHIEQGPVLEEDGITIGAVEQVQGISWTEYVIDGVSNHAGTTPMRLRHDAGHAAAAIATFVRNLAEEMGGNQVATVGRMLLEPNLINVIARRATITVDLRNTDEAALQQAEARTRAFIDALAAREGLTIRATPLVRLEPVDFDPELVAQVEARARALGHSVRRMPSGAGHDAQMIARLCPTAMIFVPSVRGISHNVQEYTDPADIKAGADILLNMTIDLIG